MEGFRGRRGPCWFLLYCQPVPGAFLYIVSLEQQYVPVKENVSDSASTGNTGLTGRSE